MLTVTYVANSIKVPPCSSDCGSDFRCTEGGELGNGVCEGEGRRKGLGDWEGVRVQLSPEGSVGAALGEGVGTKGE